VLKSILFGFGWLSNGGGLLGTFYLLGTFLSSGEYGVTDTFLTEIDALIVVEVVI